MKSAQYAHPDTRAALGIWRDLKAGQKPQLPQAAALRILSRMFVLDMCEGRFLVFRIVGPDFADLFARELLEQDFLSLWSASDARMMAALVEAVDRNGACALAHADGLALDGARLGLEIALAPLRSLSGTGPRVLGWANPLGAEDFFRSRPLQRLKATALFPPDDPKA